MIRVALYLSDKSSGMVAVVIVNIGGEEKEERGKGKERHRSTCPKAQRVFLVALSFKTHDASVP